MTTLCRFSALLTSLLVVLGAPPARSGALAGPVTNEGLSVEIVDLYQLPITSAVPPPSRVNVLREAPDGSDRLFVNDLNGRLYVIDGGTIQIYMDLESLLPDFKNTPGIAAGFVSFAMHPEFATTGRLYTNHTAAVVGPPNHAPALPSSVAQHSVVIEWTATDPTANAFAGTSRELMRIAAPTPFHPLGELAFNPYAVPGDEDYGLLYLGSGDYGTGTTGQEDQLQRLDAVLGTMMRIDPLGGPFVRDGITYDYGIPPTNPFAGDGDPATLGEIYAYGFRNVQRFTWDAVTRKVFMSDIGQGNIEEVNVLAPGGNYGWPLREGTFALDVAVDRETVLPLPANDASFGFLYPAAQYDHAEGFAIAGGVAYRGSDVPALQDRFVLGDIVNGRIFYANLTDLIAADDGDPATTAPLFELNLLRNSQPTSVLALVRAAQGDPTITRTDIRFHVDLSGEIYVTTKQDGMIRRLMPAVPCMQDSDCDDGVFCNGAETCQNTACLFGTDPCPGEICDEASLVCEAPVFGRHSDDFDRPNLGPDWIVDNLSFDVDANQLVETAPQQAAPAQMRYGGGRFGGDVGSPEQFAKIQIVDPLTTTPAGFIFNANDPVEMLGAHYEVHLDPDDDEWRWEYYDPGFVNAIDVCPSSEMLVASNWIGATVTGSGLSTAVEVYRWDTDPDAGGDVDVAANWGAPDCTLVPSTSPLASGHFGGIRFYGNDAMESRADNWMFGSLGPPPPIGDPVRGGLLWDSWFDVLGAADPTGEHPLYPPVGQQTGSDTFRCVECHGWDYAGASGEFASGPHFTGIPGVLGSSLTPFELFDLIQGNAVADAHDFASYGLADEDVWDLVQFLLDQVIDTTPLIDSGGAFVGDPVAGLANYTSGCAFCHGDDGASINFQTVQDPLWVGTIAVQEPAKLLHKARFGHPGSAMPSWIATGGDDQGAADIGVHAQANLAIDCLQDLDCSDGLFCNGAEVCTAGLCGPGTPTCIDMAHCDEGADVCLECIADAECSDGVFCTGVELCTAGTCGPGADPCTGAACAETAQICLPTSCSVDAECDDGLFCSGAEACVGSTCVLGTPTCVDAAHCDESGDRCLECLQDNECSDGAFCNGGEACVANVCVPGVEPCIDLLHCDEGADQCLDCVSDAECTDGSFCTGSETCVAGACAVGDDPCSGLICDEVGLVCTAPVIYAFSDDFDRAALGPDWAVDNLSFAISNDELIEDGPKISAPAQMRWQGGVSGGATGSTWQYAKIQIAAPITTTPAGFILNANDPADALGPHYEVHYKLNDDEWRWEFYDPSFVAVVGSCPATEGLSAFDWIGATVTGTGPSSLLSVYRWDADPDAGSPVDVDANWGPADCVMSPLPSVPFASGLYGGLRFYGSDSAQSRADNWSFGSILAPIPCTTDAQCDDGLFCTGAETCVAGVCNPGTPECVDPAHCDEVADVCLDCVVDAECDDGLFCSGAETCVEGFCDPGSDPCPGETCEESTDVCMPPPCSVDADCDDGAACNGAETCVAGMCQAGLPLCTTPSLCDEVGDVCTAISTDPLAPSLWGLDNVAQTGGTAGADIAATDAWRFGVGSPTVVVAVLDTGVDYTHEDLAANIWTNPGEIPDNAIDDDGNGYVDDTMGWDFFNGDNDPFDDGGHGTHLAGIIGAVGNNGVGVVGVNHTVKIMPLKMQSATQVGSIAAAIEAIDYAVANGAHVMSNSWAASAAWGEPGHDQPGFAPALQAAIEAANAAGVLFVATAGNSSEDKDQIPIFPATYDNDNVVAVAATDDDDVLAGFSNFGPTSIDLAAPGIGILSTVPSSCFLIGPPPGGGACDGSGYLDASGTSMSTPYVSGVAALVLARFPGISIAALKDRLLFGTDPLPSLGDVTVSGGRLNAAKAIEDDVTAPSAISDLTGSRSTDTTATISFTAPGDDATAGTARAYDIRYSTTPIDAANFDAATALVGAPLPQPAGSAESADLTGLDPAEAYHVAAKAIDNVGNRGPISNVAFVPEPGFVALLASGLTGLALLSRRRDRR